MERRTTEDIARQADEVLAVLARNKRAMRADELAEEMSVPTRHLEKPLKLLRREDRVLVAGAKRWTLYAGKMPRVKQIA